MIFLNFCNGGISIAFLPRPPLDGSAGASGDRGVLGDGAEEEEVFWETAAMSWPAGFTPRLLVVIIVSQPRVA